MVTGQTALAYYLGLRVQGLASRGTIPMMENHMEKKIDNDMKTRVISYMRLKRLSQVVTNII